MKNKKTTTADLLKFLIPSLLGILLFMIPIPFQGKVTIPVAIFADQLKSALESQIPAIMMIIITITAIGTLLAKIAKPNFIMSRPFLNNLFHVNMIWVISRVLAAIFVIMTFYKIGPEAIWSDDTGGLLLTDLLVTLFCVFLFAGLLLPLLLNFGLLDLFGALLTKVMRPLFKLPGRSSIDALASWLGDGTIGVLLTSKQYEEGYYTKREAAIIGTTFSIVSITFSMVIIATVDLAHLFVPYYLTITFAGLVCALIMPRIWPLAKKADTYYQDKPSKQTTELIPEGYTRFGYGLEQAQLTARNNRFTTFFKDGIQNVLDMWMGVAPIVMAFGTLALIIAENTKIFQWLGMPFIPLLELMQVPEAQAASQTLVIGFADMFLPSVLAAGIESEMTRFIIASISVSQLIYMSEVGGLLLGSKVPVSFKDLVVIFFLRTLISLPIIVLVAHLLF